MGSPQKIFDVIVLGIGSMGSAAAYYLTRSGASVLGLEQFDIPHEWGSHAGQSRIIRKAYFEHPDYVPLLEKAYGNWHDIEQRTGAEIFHKTGLLYFGKPGHQLIAGTMASAEQYRVPLEKYTEGERKALYPQVRIPEEYVTLYEPDAGFVTPERAILAFVSQAISLGAIIKTKTRVLHWTADESGCVVQTDSGIYRARKLVITAGPWTASMVPEIAGRLQVTRQAVAWVIPKNPALYTLGNWPCWTLSEDGVPGIFYGFPMLPVEKFGGPVGFKIAHHCPGQPTLPDQVSRQPTPEDEQVLLRVLQQYFSDGYAFTHVMKTCLYTNTPDEHFIIDQLPAYAGRVTIAAGFSGHGFKFVSAVGEILSDLALEGKTAMPIEFLSASRFG